MGTKVTIGGDRLGAGKKMQVGLHGWKRSSHDIGRIFRTDQSVGTIVPCFCDIGTLDTTYYVNLATKVRTLPTNGPIFGTFKHQVDVFQAPIRLYIGALHNNALGIGLNMKQIKLPVFQTTVPTLNYEEDDLNSQQINQSSLLAYLGVRGLGDPQGKTGVTATMPAIFLLMYWDIYKNYYSNKQEEVGYLIKGQAPHLPSSIDIFEPISATQKSWSITNLNWPAGAGQELTKGWYFYLRYNDGILPSKKEVEQIILKDTIGSRTLSQAGVNIEQDSPYAWKVTFVTEDSYEMTEGAAFLAFNDSGDVALESFLLAAIDDMREEILMTPKVDQMIINDRSATPYSTPFKTFVDNTGATKIQSFYSQVGLGLRTYLSDRFNNWLSTEWIDGEGGINEITSIDVSEGFLQINELILQKKIFDMLNRIAVSDGTYKSWLEVNYDGKMSYMVESPIYEGGLSSEIVFDEVVSSSDATTAAGEDQPLGSLAGRGSDKNTRGKGTIKVKMREPSMIMILESIVPRVDYSQGNKWWNKLETMDDLHKPALDAIGFQELPTDEICAFDLKYNTTTGAPIYNSAGKQPSWIEYMTNVNETYGSFVAGGSLEHMAVNRKYSHDKTTGRIKDLTTYIDPTIYNAAFADHNLTSRNFWVQIAIDCTVRRKMSAKQIPNL